MGRFPGGPRYFVGLLHYTYRVTMDAFWLFLDDDGWAIASHIALSALMALFPFLIVLTAAVALIALSFFVILGPLIFNRALRYAPWIAPFENMVTFARLGAASLVLIITLVVTHLWLPAGRRRLWEIAPGVVATLMLWLAGGLLFGRYLAEFADAYVTY